ncbi:conserved hypothetical protein [Sphingomonas sp. EC-HK361]|uniref:hypothetical protein n=1 Tax=Sphingomonas sp. EC-HK361 TaxID=2038397 RepID=UPI0012595E58|nr:hypothetical protein [Sphingomonas sp. EC-HK361]VVT00296.1 conserved hypothetical protein [Sphingomonas sp. EC-HK361]
MILGTHRAVIAEGFSAFEGRKWVRWTKKMREAFLDHLAATCNVQASAAFIGVDPVCVYALRRREPAFADAWGVALALGYEMLETRLVGHALAGETGTELTCGADTKSGPINVDLAVRMLTAHRDATGKPKRGGPRRQFAESDDTDAALMKKLTQIEARRARLAAKTDA